MHAKVDKKSGKVKVRKWVINKMMHSKAVPVLADDHSLRWVGGDEGSMMHKDFLIFLAIKLLIKEWEL